MADIAKNKERYSEVIEEWKDLSWHRDVWYRSSGGQFVPSGLTGKYSKGYVELLGARQCTSPEEKCRQTFLPSAFNFCPDCSTPLESPQVSIAPDSFWLPPSVALSASTPANFTGMRGTQQSIKVKPEDDSGVRADTYLPMPHGANYRFIVGAFGWHAARLVAIDIKTHSLFVLNPDDNTWSRLEDLNGYVTDSILPMDAWGCVVTDPVHSDAIYLACEQGVVEVSINLVTQHFESRIIVSGQAKAAPVVRDNLLYVPIKQGESTQLCQYDLQEPDREGVFFPLPEQAVGLYLRAVQDERKIIWVSEHHQLIISFAGDKLSSSLTPWLNSINPEFEFGPPARYHNQYWQLCFDHSQDAYCYVRLGSAASTTEIHSTPNPRLSTGFTHFLDSENYHSGEPWFVGEKINDTGEILLPIVEFGVNLIEVSSITPTALCIRFQSPESLKGILDSTHRQACEVVVLGEPEQTLERFKVSRPWESQSFVYNGYLWLYHWELKNISGWRLESGC